MLRRFIPKGKSIDDYTADEIMIFADIINALPRKILGYRTPDELFEAELDRIYTAWWSSVAGFAYCVQNFIDVILISQFRHLSFYILFPLSLFTYIQYFINVSCTTDNRPYNFPWIVNKLLRLTRRQGTTPIDNLRHTALLSSSKTGRYRQTSAITDRSLYHS